MNGLNLVAAVKTRRNMWRKQMVRNSNSGRRQSAAAANIDEINGCLRNLLRGYNDRDAEATNRHLKTLRDTLERNADDIITTRFGGSVAKHTFVDGRSDVDVLFIVNNSSLSGQSPGAAIRYMRDLFRKRLPRTKITAGDLAVTVEFADGIVQVLPAIRTKAGYRIADPERRGWSNVVYPERFANKLTAVNQANQGRVIPTVKLAKPLSAQIIQSEQGQISGYHMEALAIKAFTNYRGPYDLRSMLGHFCNASATAVLHPIDDLTKQSKYVDEHMGNANSRQRQRAARHFKTMAQRLNACKSAADVTALFG